MSLPESEFSDHFVHLMMNRMGMSYYKYGPCHRAFPKLVDALATMEKYVELYKQTGNRERLVDAANYLMIEFMYPRHPDAHFTPTESKDSPGRKWIGESDFSVRRNDE
jgi:hypothetical protein